MKTSFCLLIVICLYINYVVDCRINTVSSSVSSSVSSISSSKDKSRQKQLINFFSGGLAGTISSVITAPLEVVKTQLQSSQSNKGNLIDTVNQIWKSNGIKGFYRGIKPSLFGIIPTRAIYFWSYTTTKNALNSTSLGSTPLTHLLSAFSAGITR